MSQPGPPTPPEQEQLIQQIGRLILRALPPGWQEARVEYRAVGTHAELISQLVAPNGTVVPLTAPSELGQMFGQLRHGMFDQQRGTWISALYRLQRPSSYSVDFNGDHEPAWQTAPPDSAYTEELQRYPRPTERVPKWLAERAGQPGNAGGAPAEPSARLRVADVFDGADPSGRPIANRPGVAPEERQRLADYLDRAPVILATGNFDPDRLDPSGAPAVPQTFHTDGNWVWPGAVGYYLRQHNVPPQADLIEHIRGRGFQIPDLDEQARERAVALVTGARSG